MQGPYATIQLICLILTAVLTALAGLGIPGVDPPSRRYHLGWFGVTFLAIAFIVAHAAGAR